MNKVWDGYEESKGDSKSRRVQKDPKLVSLLNKNQTMIS